MRRGKPGPKEIACCIALAVAGVLALVLLVRTIPLAGQAAEAARATPTPSPVYGNVMVETVNPNEPTPAPVLKRGSEGAEVTELQARLQALGYYTGALDGQFGNGTRDAVILFQQQNGLDADGAVGPETSAVLYSANARPVTITPTPQPQAQKPYTYANGLPLLVNKTHPLPEDYTPYDLVDMSSVCDSSIVKIKYSGTLAEREAVEALMVMLKAAVDEGVANWQVSAAYRTYAYQQQLMDEQVQEYITKNGLSQADALSAARKTVADPGTSEHHTGMCFDITVPGQSFKGTIQHQWLVRHCWDYGFIERYREDKESITGFLAEAWHYRYVGVEAATAMRDGNLCLEEYLAQRGIY